MDSTNYSSTNLTNLTELEELVDFETDPDFYPWGPQSDDSTPSPISRSRKQEALAVEHPWTKLVDDEEDFTPEKKPKVFSNVQLVRSRLFDGYQVNTRFDQVKSEKPVLTKQVKTRQVEQVVKELAEDVQVQSLEQETGKKSSKAYVIMNPPVAEIKGHRRRISSGDLSDLSSLSGYKHSPLEFSLENGFEGLSPFYRSVSEDIVRSLERRATLEQQNEYDNDTPFQTNVSPKCLILLMDPRKKIFEIVQVPYQPESTTVGEMLSQLHNQATDYRLARQTYTGLAYQGMHICAPMVPVDIILEAEARGRPLLAVPESYSAGQVEIMGNTLLETPKVARLLEVQLTRLAASEEQLPPLPTVIHSKTMVGKTSIDTMAKTSCPASRRYAH
jgi:hypothetical protein